MAFVRRRGLLEGGAYSELSVNGEALNKGWCLFEAWSVLEAIR